MKDQILKRVELVEFLLELMWLHKDIKDDAYHSLKKEIRKIPSCIKGCDDVPSEPKEKAPISLQELQEKATVLKTIAEVYNLIWNYNSPFHNSALSVKFQKLLDIIESDFQKLIDMEYFGSQIK